MKKLSELKEAHGSILDNTVLLYGSGASTTHTRSNLPTLLAGGKNMGIKHGSNERLSDLYLDILHSMGIEGNSFGDSTKKPSDWGVFNAK